MTSTICGSFFLLEMLGQNRVYYNNVWYVAGLEGFICFAYQYATTNCVLLAVQYISSGFWELGRNHQSQNKRQRWGVMSAMVCFIRELNTDVEKYVPINLSGSLPVWLGEEFYHDSAVVIWSDIMCLSMAHQTENLMWVETLRHPFYSCDRLLMLWKKVKSLPSPLI